MGTNENSDEPRPPETSTPATNTPATNTPDGKRKNTLLLLALGLLGFYFLRGSGEEAPQPTFSVENPNAVELTQVRSIFRANQLVERLKKMDVHAQVVTVEDVGNDAQWHKIIVGVSDDIEKTKEIQAELSEAHDFTDMKLVNYTSLTSLIVQDVASVGGEVAKIKTNLPGVGEDTLSTIQQFPYSNVFRVERLSLYDSPEEPTNRRIHSYMKKRVSNDLPRGISRSEVLKQTDAFLEAILVDNLFGHRVTINVFKMRSNSGIAGNPVDFYAQQILDTGTYNVERVTPIEVTAQEPLSGSVVTISPKKRSDDLRYYVILANPTNEWVYFSQSTTMEKQELVEVLGLIGKNQGLLSYPEFYNTFQTVPDQLDPNDTFAGINLDRIGRSYAKSKGYKRWAKMAVGHWDFSAYFHNSEKSSWSFSLFDLLRPNSSGQMFNLYSRDSGEKKRTNVYGKDAWLVETRRAYQKKWGTYAWPIEINFFEGRYICMVNNEQKYGRLNRKEMQARANQLQLGVAGGYVAAASPGDLPGE